MKNSTIGIAILLIAVIAIGTFALTSTSPLTPGSTVAAANDKATKLDIKNNNPDLWCHIDMMFNATNKNGTTQTYYIEAYVKPGSNATMDLSNALGYGNEKLPPMNLTIISWKAIYNTTAGGTGDLNFKLQGWSNTQNPGSADQNYTITYPGLPIAQLPSFLKDNYILITTNQTNASSTDNDADEPLFEQEILTVDNNGKVTLTIVIAPTLCTTLAPHPA